MPTLTNRPYLLALRGASRAVIEMDDRPGMSENGLQRLEDFKESVRRMEDFRREKPAPPRHYLSLAASILSGLAGIACPCYWPHCWASGVGLVAGLAGAFWFMVTASAAVEED